MTEELPDFAVFTNAKDLRPLQTLLWGFYNGVAQNRVGIMSAFDTKQNKETLILVGLNEGEDGITECFPLAEVLASEDAERFLSPDGEGGWINSSTVQ